MQRRKPKPVFKLTIDGYRYALSILSATLLFSAIRTTSTIVAYGSEPVVPVAYVNPH